VVAAEDVAAVLTIRGAAVKAANPGQANLPSVGDPAAVLPAAVLADEAAHRRVDGVADAREDPTPVGVAVRTVAKADGADAAEDLRVVKADGVDAAEGRKAAKAAKAAGEVDAADAVAGAAAAGAAPAEANNGN
jgi:hypothetical protein